MHYKMFWNPMLYILFVYGGQGYENSLIWKRSIKVCKNLDINHRAFCMPCACHCLNFCLCDMANSCYKAKIFLVLLKRFTMCFLTIQREKVFYWNILMIWIWNSYLLHHAKVILKVLKLSKLKLAKLNIFNIIGSGKLGWKNDMSNLW